MDVYPEHWTDKRRIAELETELARPLQHMVCDTKIQFEIERADRAEARIAAGLAVCDTSPFPDHPLVQMTLNHVRAALTGDTT